MQTTYKNSGLSFLSFYRFSKLWEILFREKPYEQKSRKLLVFPSDKAGGSLVGSKIFASV